ncbi:protein of unknown function [Nitrospira japonica]|uniref:Uncharacterized protein n=1 Tax=Nitrospira japonica TaxID=1325564 RepID=A0A1W1I5F5_9BACT|nr:protein of unknown function [Nitrospira japonica]
MPYRMEKNNGALSHMEQTPRFLYMAPRAGLEPATSRLQGLPIFRKGLDYLFTHLGFQGRVSGAREAILGRLLSL